MPSRYFLDTVDLLNDKASRNSPKWRYSCGLEIVANSIKNTPADHYVTKYPEIMRLAHERHHDGLDTDYVKPSLGESHDPTATLYFKSQDGVLLDAWCSCGYDSDA